MFTSGTPFKIMSQLWSRLIKYLHERAALKIQINIHDQFSWIFPDQEKLSHLFSAHISSCAGLPHINLKMSEAQDFCIHGQ